ncbi:MAG: AAA family ATPase [Phycisphaerae bacterium]
MINQKGGVGKTTTASNLGAAIAQRGRPICLMDLDPQAHLTLHFGIEPGDPTASVYDMLTDDASLAEATVDVGENLWVVPSVIDLAGAEVELAATVGREQILRDRIKEAQVPYDFILMDCPPSLGLLTLNALAAADEVVIPLQPHFLALQGLGKLLETVSLVQRRINPRLRVSGIILCMYESNTRLANEVREDLESFIEQSRDQQVPWANVRIFQTVIRRNVKLAECPSYGTTIFTYDPSSHGAADYNALADEFLTDPQPVCEDPEAREPETGIETSLARPQTLAEEAAPAAPVGDLPPVAAPETLTSPAVRSVAPPPPAVGSDVAAPQAQTPHQAEAGEYHREESSPAAPPTDEPAKGSAPPSDTPPPRQ